MAPPVRKKPKGLRARAGIKKRRKVKSRGVRPERLEAGQVATSKLSGSDRVTRAIDLLKKATPYSKGCSGFVCDVLQIPYEQAKDIMAGSDIDANSGGTYPNYDFSNIHLGDICGWLAADATGDIPTDHVTVYIGQTDKLFIDAKGQNQAPRAVKNGYGRQQKVWKSRNV
jgi:hypothetical protein